MPFRQIILIAEKKLAASQDQFLDDAKLKISSKNWCCWLPGNFFSAIKMIWQGGIFYYFYDII